jgi:hypothetical protein
MGRGVGGFPDPVTVIERCAELVQSHQVVACRARQWIVPIERAGTRITCSELSGFTGDQPVDFGFFFGDEVQVPALAVSAGMMLPRGHNFLLERG